MNQKNEFAVRMGIRLAVAAAVMALGAGCAAGKKDTLSVRNGPVTEISPASPTMDQPIVAAAPVTPIQPVTETTLSSGNSAAIGPVAGASGGKNYVVKKGDTLFKIAREQYGDAKAWHKIASANPNVVNGQIKVGQKLVLP